MWPLSRKQEADVQAAVTFMLAPGEKMAAAAKLRKEGGVGGRPQRLQLRVSAAVRYMTVTSVWQSGSLG